jgi:acyl carrier protein
MTLEKVKQLVAAQLNQPIEKVTDKARLIEDLGADSLDIMEMLMSLEDEFGISIADEETAQMTTIEGVAKVIDSKLK